MKIFIASDHAGYTLKSKLSDFIRKLDYDVEDLGPMNYDIDDDYPDFVKKVAEKVSENPHSYRGIVIGGSGQGEGMVANRHQDVRCAVFYGPIIAKGEVDISGDVTNDPYVILKLSREHNDANMLSLGARFLSDEEARRAVADWLSAPFSGQERHKRRLLKF